MKYIIREDICKCCGIYNDYYICKDFSNSLDEEYINKSLKYNKEKNIDRSHFKYNTFTFFRIHSDGGYYSISIDNSDNTDIIVMDI